MLEGIAMRKRGRKMLLLAVFMMALVSLPARASEGGEGNSSGSVRIHLKDLESAGSERSGVEFGLWRVGDVDEYGTPKIWEQYGIGEYPQDSASMQEAADKLEGMAADRQADLSGVTDQNGEVLFDRVAQGVYLICAAEGNPYGEISPFLVQLPYWEEVGGQMTGPIYQVEAEPKASPYPPEEPDTEEPDVVKTGDTADPGTMAWALVCAACATALAARIRTKNKVKGDA